MSGVTNDVAKASVGASQERGYDLSKVSAGCLITGIVLGAIIAGVVATLSYMSHTYPDVYKEFGCIGGENIRNKFNEMGIVMGVCISEVGGILAIGLIAGGAIGYGYHAMKKKKKEEKGVAQVAPESVKGEAEKKRLWEIAKWVGIIVALIGVGMIMASAVALNHEIPAIKDLRDHTPGHTQFWKDVQSQWIGPNEERMRLMLGIGTVTAVAGGAIFTVSGGYQLCSAWIKKYFAEKVDTNELVVERGTGEL